MGPRPPCEEVSKNGGPRFAKVVTHNGGMSTDADIRTDAMSHGTISVGDQLLVHLSQTRSSADGGLPSGSVHAEVLKVDQIQCDNAIRATEPCAWG